MSFNYSIRRNKHSKINLTNYLASIDEPKSRRSHLTEQIFDIDLEEDIWAMKQNFRKIARSMRSKQHINL